MSRTSDDDTWRKYLLGANTDPAHSKAGVETTGEKPRSIWSKVKDWQGRWDVGTYQANL